MPPCTGSKGIVSPCTAPRGWRAWLLSCSLGRPVQPPTPPHGRGPFRFLPITGKYGSSCGPGTSPNRCSTMSSFPLCATSWLTTSSTAQRADTDGGGLTTPRGWDTTQLPGATLPLYAKPWPCVIPTPGPVHWSKAQPPGPSRSCGNICFSASSSIAISSTFDLPPSRQRLRNWQYLTHEYPAVALLPA